MSSSDSRHADQTRTYNRASSVVFLKTDAPFGGLSNMAGGYPLRVNGIRILTSEALYQACRFPHRPEVQTLIIEQKSPMTAKMKSKPYRHDSRPDWDQVRVKIMRWCLRVKLAQNWRTFSELLLATGERPIVEESRKDAFWGAKATDDGTLVGMNVLGRLLMELREAVKADGLELLMRVQPLTIPDFLLGGRQIEAVGSQAVERDVESATAAVAHARGETQGPIVKQPSLFDAPAVTEAPPAAYLAVRAKGVHVADLKPYPAYRQAEGGWLGEVPSHWTIRRMKYVVREIDSRSTTGKEQLLRISQYTGVTQRRRADGLEEPDTRADSLVGYKRVRPDDLVINIMLAWNGSMGVSRYEGIASPAYCVYRFGRNLRPWYFHNLLRSPAYKARIKASSTGVVESRLRLYSDDLGRIEAMVPPPDEQAAIVRFLDWANGRLERAIRGKRKVIALLNEQKQAIIHRAVTRGVNPSVPLKPSGIPWLGDIPQHWEVRRAKYLFREVDLRSVLGAETHLAMSQKLGLVPSSMVQSTLRSESYAGGKLCDAGDLVLNRLKAHLGVFAVAKQPGVVSPDYSVFRKLGDIHTRYFECMLRSSACRRELRIRAKGIVEGFWRLYTDDFYDIRLPIPPVAEQRQTMISIDEQTQEQNTAISRLEREIELLREYRTRLVADVVTGKLDVREAAARLPDEAPLDTAEDGADLTDETESAYEEAVV